MPRGKTYSQEFREHAVRLSDSPGKTAAGVARELGISIHTLHEWRRKLKPSRPKRSEHKQSDEVEDLEKENRRLKRELERTREEAEILRQAIAYFAHPPKK